MLATQPQVRNIYYSAVTDSALNPSFNFLSQVNIHLYQAANTTKPQVRNFCCSAVTDSALNPSLSFVSGSYLSVSGGYLSEASGT